MLKTDLHPPHSGLGADPVLYGVAAGLAELFPPVMTHLVVPAERDARSEADPDGERNDGD